MIMQDLQYEARLDIVFYQDNMKESKPSNVKAFKIDPDPDNVTTTVLITEMVENPDKYAHSMMVKYKEKSIMCCCDNKSANYLIVCCVYVEHYIEKNLSNGLMHCVTSLRLSTS